MKNIRHFFEPLIWIAALIFLGFFNPSYLSLCPVKNFFGVNCPGCGLGHSIHLLMHGQFEESFAYHFMGLPALIIITGRIIKVFYININKTGQT